MNRRGRVDFQPHCSFYMAREQNEYFGVAFLSRLGYFDRNKRFWTAKEFPEAAEIRERIIGFIQKHRENGAAGGTYYENALRELR